VICLICRQVFRFEALQLHTKEICTQERYDQLNAQYVSCFLENQSLQFENFAFRAQSRNDQQLIRSYKALLTRHGVDFSLCCSETKNP